MVQLILAEFNGSGGYRLTWSEPVTVLDASDAEANLLGYSPSSGYWTPLVATATGTGNVNEWNDVQDNEDCNTFVLLSQPVVMTAANPFELALPQLEVS